MTIRPEFAAALQEFEGFLDANGDGIDDREQGSAADPNLSMQPVQAPREPSVRERLNAERQRRGMGDVPLGDIETGNVQTTPEEDDLARETLGHAADATLTAGMLAMPFPAIPAAVARGGAALYGMTTGVRQANSGEDADLRELRRELEAQEGPELKSRRSALDTARSRITTLDDDVRAAEANKQKMNNPSNRRSLDAAKAMQSQAQGSIPELERLYNDELARHRTETGDRVNSVMTGRKNAEAERSRVRSAAPRTFNEMWSGAQKELPLLPDANWLPAIVGGGAVAARKALPFRDAWAGNSRAEALLAKGSVDDIANADVIASTHRLTQRNDSKWKSVLSPEDAAVGAVAGSTTGTLPLAFNGITQGPRNPEYDAQNAFVSQLLDIDPRKQAARDVLASTPVDNPNFTPLNFDTLVNRYGPALATAAFEGGVTGKTVGLFANSAFPRFSHVDEAVGRFGDDVAAEKIRMRGAEAYGQQSPSVPLPGAYQPRPALTAPQQQLSPPASGQAQLPSPSTHPASAGPAQPSPASLPAQSGTAGPQGLLPGHPHPLTGGGSGTSSPPQLPPQTGPAGAPPHGSGSQSASGNPPFTLTPPPYGGPPVNATQNAFAPGPAALPDPNQLSMNFKPSYAPYSPQHSAVARDGVDELLGEFRRKPDAFSSMGPEMILNRRPGQPSLAERFEGNGLPAVDPADLTRRATGTLGGIRDMDAVMRSPGTGRRVTNPKHREDVLNATTGKDHTLSIAGAGAAGAAVAAGGSDEAEARPSTRERYEALKGERRSTVTRREMMANPPKGAADFDPKAGRYRGEDGAFIGF